MSLIDSIKGSVPSGGINNKASFQRKREIIYGPGNAIIREAKKARVEETEKEVEKPKRKEKKARVEKARVEEPEEEVEEPEEEVEEPKRKEKKKEVKKPKLDEPEEEVEKVRVEEPKRKEKKARVEEPEEEVEKPKVDKPKRKEKKARVEEPEEEVEKPKRKEKKAKKIAKEEEGEYLEDIGIMTPLRYMSPIKPKRIYLPSDKSQIVKTDRIDAQKYDNTREMVLTNIEWNKLGNTDRLDNFDVRPKSPVRVRKSKK